MEKMEQIEKKVRGTYKIDKTKTPQENITEVLKLVMPIKLTVNKLLTGKDSNSATNNFEMEGVQIIAIGRYKFSTTTDIDDFRKIHFYMKIPGNLWGREGRRSWSVPIKNEKISLTHISNVFNALSLRHKQGKVEEEQKQERIKLEKKNLEKLRTKSKMPSNFHLSVNYYPKKIKVAKTSNGCQLVEPVQPIEYSIEKYSVSLHIRELSEKQIMKIGKLCAEIDGIAKDKDLGDAYTYDY